MLRAEEFEKIDENSFLAQFRQQEIGIFYSYRSGAYKIERNNANADLMLFKNCSGTMKRIGLESYYFYFNYQWHHNFPAKAIEPPLPSVEFCLIKMMAPRGGLSFQKYHYGNDWFQEKKPKYCDKNI